MSTNPRHAVFKGGQEGVHRKLAVLEQKQRKQARKATPAPSSGSDTGPIDGSRIISGSLTSDALVTGTITAAYIGAGQIYGDLIAAAAIVADKIASNAIWAGSIQAGAVTAGTIAADAVVSTSIQAGAIQAQHMDVGSVSANAIQAGAIQAQHLAAGSITVGSTAITDGAIITRMIGAEQVTTNKIEAGAITADRLAANTITAAQIAAGTITAHEIATNTITADRLAANTITAAQIAAHTITANEIASNTITADQITTTALTTMWGTAGALTGGTITGGIFQTSASASSSRVVLDSLGLHGYGLDGVTKIFNIDAGSGIASFTGIANIDPSSVIPGSAVSLGSLPGDRIQSNSIQTLQLAAGSVTTNTLAAGSITASKISVEFGGSNMLWNSSFEDPTGAANNWEATGATISGTNNEIVAFSGRTVAKLVATAAGAIGAVTSSLASVLGYTGSYGTTGGYPGYYPLIRGKTYTLSGFVASPVVSRNATATLYWYDGLLRTALPAPTAPSTAVVASGGTLAAGTYYYKITAVNANGETVGSTEVSATVTSGQAVDITALMPPNASGTTLPVTGMRVYRRTAAGSYSGYLAMATGGGVTTTLRDTGQALTGTATPPAASTATTVAALSTSGVPVATTVGAGNAGTVLTTSTVLVTSTSQVTGSGSAGTGTVWQRVVVTSAPPAGAVYCRASIGVAGVAVGEIHYIDGVMLEPGDIPTGYSQRPGEVLPGTVGATQITPNSITANEILAASVQAVVVTASAIAATNGNISNLISNSINAVNITGSYISGGTITGATVNTAVSGNRVEMSGTSLKVVQGGTNVVTLDPSTGLSFSGGNTIVNGFDWKNTGGALIGMGYGWENLGSGGFKQVALNTGAFSNSANSANIQLTSFTTSSYSTVDIIAYGASTSSYSRLLLDAGAQTASASIGPVSNTLCDANGDMNVWRNLNVQGTLTAGQFGQAGGDVYFFNPPNGAHPIMHLRGSNSPADSSTWIGIQYDFNSAGVAQLRAARGASWDTSFGVFVNAAGGYGLSASAYFDTSGVHNTSDATLKADHHTVDRDEILAKIRRLDVTEWVFKYEPRRRNLGPTAQQFQTLFGYGNRDGISTLNQGGVMLVGIQAVDRRVDTLRAEVVGLRHTVQQLISELTEAAGEGFTAKMQEWDALYHELALVGV